jgi:hypothetical protein
MDTVGITKVVCEWKASFNSGSSLKQDHLLENLFNHVPSYPSTQEIL